MEFIFDVSGKLQTNKKNPFPFNSPHRDVSKSECKKKNRLHANEWIFSQFCYVCAVCSLQVEALHPK